MMWNDGYSRIDRLSKKRRQQLEDKRGGRETRYSKVVRLALGGYRMVHTGVALQDALVLFKETALPDLVRKV